MQPDITDDLELPLGCYTDVPCLPQCCKWIYRNWTQQTHAYFDNFGLKLKCHLFDLLWIAAGLWIVVVQQIHNKRSLSLIQREINIYKFRHCSALFCIGCNWILSCLPSVGNCWAISLLNTIYTDRLLHTSVMFVSVAQWANRLSEPQYLLGLAGWWPAMAWFQIQVGAWVFSWLD